MKYPKKIRALVNLPNMGSVLKDEIGIHIERNKYNFPSQNPYSVDMNSFGILYEVVIDEPTYEIY